MGNLAGSNNCPVHDSCAVHIVTYNAQLVRHGGISSSSPADNANYSDSIATFVLACYYDPFRCHDLFSLSLSLPQLLACCINASCLALMNAGLAMKCTVAAVRCVIIGESRRIVVDPSEKDVVGSDGVDQAAEFTFVFDSVERKAVSCHCSGRYSPEEFQEAMLAAQAASAEVFEFYRASLRKFIRIL